MLNFGSDKLADWFPRECTNSIRSFTWKKSICIQRMKICICVNANDACGVLRMQLFYALYPVGL